MRYYQIINKCYAIGCVCNKNSFFFFVTSVMGSTAGDDDDDDDGVIA